MTPEPEVALPPEMFDAVCTGAAPAPLPLGIISTRIYLVIEVEGGRRTGRWAVTREDSIFHADPDRMLCVYRWAVWPPAAACYSRNDAAAREPLMEAMG